MYIQTLANEVKPLLFFLHSIWNCGWNSMLYIHRVLFIISFITASFCFSLLFKTFSFDAFYYLIQLIFTCLPQVYCISKQLKFVWCLSLSFINIHQDYWTKGENIAQPETQNIYKYKCVVKITLTCRSLESLTSSLCCQQYQLLLGNNSTLVLTVLDILLTN